MDHSQIYPECQAGVMDIHGQPYEVEVSVDVHFRASHALPTRPELHEHIWQVTFGVCGPINEDTGMVCDMLDLARFFKPFAKELDDRNLHEFEGFQNKEGLLGLTAKYPTCDTLAHYFLWRAIPAFRAEPKFQGLRIARVAISIMKPNTGQQWGSTSIRPAG